MTDLARVRKIYKLNEGRGGGKNGVKGGIDDERKEVEILVMGCIALRGSTN
jgi:EKC/KEOPS complex subunit CGI121/TPRKB